MIKIYKTPKEPPALRDHRNTNLPLIRLKSSSPSGIKSDDIKDYQVARRSLASLQYFKCCYCEKKIELKHNAVEHFRPKVKYWWLSWSWSNLFFVCEICNEHKSDSFDMMRGESLEPEKQDIYKENPFFVDFVTEDPFQHIEFKLFTVKRHDWRPIARGGSRRGAYMISKLALDRRDLMRLYQGHAELVYDDIQKFKKNIKNKSNSFVKENWDRMVYKYLSDRSPFTALSCDMINYYFSPVWRRRHQVGAEIIYSR
jgi:uncharacterized protein (TIGR02646 family)